MTAASPRISVVIAAYNIANFVEQAVLSAVQQSTPFHEIIVIDDASNDGTSAIVDTLAAEYTALTVIHNSQNQGLGPVRNHGIAVATGDYVCFLDGDDYLVPDAVAHLQNQLMTKPDIILFNHARLYPNGVIAPNSRTDLLAVGTHTEPMARKALFANLNVAWNKLYARNFLTRTAICFPVGTYEDIAWNYTCLMQADTIVTTPHVLVHYRQRDGSILQSRSLKHFDIFERWEELFAVLAEKPALMETYGDILKVRRYQSFARVLDEHHRLPRRARARFAARMRAICGPVKALPRANIPRSERILDLPGGQYLRPFRNSPLVGWARAWALAALKWLRAHRYWHKVLFYRLIFLRMPLARDLVVYQSYWGRKIACNPYALFEHLRQTRPGLQHVWVVKSGADLRTTVGQAIHVREHSWRYYYLMARARILINNANFPDTIIKRKGSLHVQTKHGTPLKYMGLDQLRIDPDAFADPDAFVRRSSRWDYVISSNRYSSRVWRQGFPYHYQMLETGYPRNDRLVNSSQDEQLVLRQAMGLSHDHEVVLYAPTFRPDYPPNALPQPELEDILEAILAGLGPKQVLAVRTHYFTQLKGTLAKDPRVFDLSRITSTTDVLLVADLLITDYSSIMFDYAVRQKPIVVLGHDLDHYAAARGVYFDISTEHPGVFCTSLPEVTQALQDRAYDTPEVQAKLAAFHAKFCVWDDGTAAEKVCNLLFELPSGN